MKFRNAVASAIAGRRIEKMLIVNDLAEMNFSKSMHSGVLGLLRQAT